jgi:hypothetical protein
MYCYKPHRVVRVFVTVVRGDEVKIVLWQGRSERRIRVGARRRYHDADQLVFGSPFWWTP